MTLPPAMTPLGRHCEERQRRGNRLQVCEFVLLDKTIDLLFTVVT